MRIILWLTLGLVSLSEARGEGSCMEPDPVLFLKPKPNCQFRVGESSISLNEFGIVGPISSEKKGARKLLLIGPGVTFNATPQTLEKTMEEGFSQALKKPVTVINGEVLGFTPAQYVFFLPMLLEAYRPNMVLYLLSSGSNLHENALLFHSVERDETGAWKSLRTGDVARRKFLSAVPFLSTEAKRRLAVSLDFRQAQIKLVSSAFNRKKGGNAVNAMMQPLVEPLFELRKAAGAKGSSFYAIWPGGRILSEGKNRDQYGYGWLSTLSRPFEGSFDVAGRPINSFFNTGRLPFLLQINEIYTYTKAPEGLTGPSILTQESSKAVATAIVDTMERAGVFDRTRIRGRP